VRLGTNLVPKITFIEFSGKMHCVDGEIGGSLMQAAVGNMVPGIQADCGGCCSCGTCHCYVDDAWVGRLPPPAIDELDMLEGALETQESSRLSCQIKITSNCDGLVVRLPKSQV